MTVRLLRCLGVLVGWLAFANPASAQTLQDLGVLGGGSGASSQAAAVNVHGDVAGTSTTDAGIVDAFLWRRGAGMTNLDVLGQHPGFTSVTVAGINASRQIIGNLVDASGNRQAFVWSNGATTLIGALYSAPSITATGINDAGVVVGYMKPAAEQCGGCSFRAFKWQGGLVSDLGVLNADHPSAYATDINNAGQIAGASAASATTLHAVLWEPDSGPTDLFASDATNSSSASHLSEAGHVAGVSTAGGGQAFLYRPDAPPALATMLLGSTSVSTDGGMVTGLVTGVNDFGYVIGVAGAEDGHSAVLWGIAGADVVVTPLGDLGGGHSVPLGINDNEIVGLSFIANGDNHAFKWSGGGMVDLGSIGGAYTWPGTDRGDCVCPPSVTSSRAVAISSTGVIAGSSVTSASVSHAFALFTASLPTQVSVADASGAYGGTVTLQATLTSSGSPLSGKTVSFTLNGTAAGDATTDAAGVATIEASLGTVAPGSHASGIAASFAGDGDFTSSSGAALLTVNQLTPSVVWNAPAPISYGIALDATQLNATANVDGDFAYSPDAGTVLGAGANQVLTVVFTPASANYAPVTLERFIAVNPAESVVLVTCVGGPFTYDGSEQRPCTAGVTGAGGLNQQLAVSYTDNVNAGTVTASATYAGDANHTGSTAQDSFTIGQAASTTTVTCASGPFTFDGSAHTPCSAAASGAGGFSQPLTVSYADNIGAGAAMASASFAGDANHTGSDDQATFTIGVAPSSTTVTCGAGPFTENGTPHTPCTATVTGAGGLNQSLTVTYAGNVAAGTATASASFGGGPNHGGSSGEATFTIEPADEQQPTTTTVTCSRASVRYNGAAHTFCAASVTGPGGLNQQLAVTYSDNVNAGTVTASATFAGDDDYAASSGSATFTIRQARSIVRIACTDRPFLYTGEPVTPCTATATGVGGLAETVPVVYASNVNAGVATASASYAGDANHTPSSRTRTFTIRPAASVTTVTCGAGPFTYNGSAHTPCTATVTGDGGLSQSLTVTYLDNVDAGRAKADASFEGGPNHKPSHDRAAFDIGKATPVIAWTNPAPVMAGTPLSETQLNAAANVAGAFNYQPNPGARLRAGEHTLSVEFTPVDRGNYTRASATVTITAQSWATAVQPLMGLAAASGQQPLINKIDNVLESLDRGNLTQAGNQLASFIDQVQTLVTKRKLTAAQGQAMIDAANALLASIGS